MRDRLHGIVSLGLIAAALALGFGVLLRASVALGLIYGLTCLAGSLLIVYAYCTKCPVGGAACRHVFPGRLAQRLPARPSHGYRTIDYLGVVLPLGLMLFLPQPWLASEPTPAVLFWALTTAGLVEILWFVCRGCGNTRCPLRALRNARAPHKPQNG